MFGGEISIKINRACLVGGISVRCVACTMVVMHKISRPTGNKNPVFVFYPINVFTKKTTFMGWKYFIDLHEGVSELIAFQNTTRRLAVY